jgi:hypothetical protein
MTEQLRAPVGGGGDYNPAPAGLQDLLLVDIIDRGYRLNDYNKQDIKVQRKIAFRYALDAIDEDTGKQFFVDDVLTFSMDKRATMRARVSSGLGQEFSDEEAGALDIETLVGMQFQGMIVHKDRGDRVYANIQTIMPQAKGSTPIALLEEYERTYKDYSGSERWPSVDPTTKKPLSAEQIEVLNAMPHSVRGDLKAAIESVVFPDEAEAPSDADDPGE